MLTDMILEEEFEKNGEPWYDPQDLEHGKLKAARLCGRTLNSVWMSGLIMLLLLRQTYIHAAESCSNNSHPKVNTASYLFSLNSSLH